MAIGRAAMVMLCVMVASVALISFLAIAIDDKSTDDYYYNESNSANHTATMTQQITTAGAGMLLPLSLVAAILFVAAVLAIFKSRRK